MSKSDLNVNKARGHDDISLRMIKICYSALVEPLSTIFNNSLKTGTFPYIWKKSNVIPAHKKMISNSLIIIDLFSLLPIFGKVFEMIVFDNIYRCLDEHNLLNPNQSEFKPKNSCIYQLIEIAMIFFLDLIVILLLKLRQCYEIFQRLLINSGISIYYKHLNQ